MTQVLVLSAVQWYVNYRQDIKHKLVKQINVNLSNSNIADCYFVEKALPSKISVKEDLFPFLTKVKGVVVVV